MRKVGRSLWMCWVACAVWIGAGLLIGFGKAQAQSVRADEPAAAGRSYLNAIGAALDPFYRMTVLSREHLIVGE